MIRVRFAPSPTGDLHIGNVRAALFNYLFAKKYNGKFILRVEDTDQKRNIAEGYTKIIDDLAWLGLGYDEGPDKGGKYGPYLQSERTNIYQEKLDELIEAKKVYRCFCSEKELEVRRARQAKLGQPPRYNKMCLGMSDDMVKQEIIDGTPFVWRLNINEEACVEIETLTRGTIKFEMKNFGDFSITRSDGSFKFLFTNFIDDWLMNITHVIRGEDHLSNTAMQGALFDAFAVPLPKFWHLSLICGKDGKKLSKRDFGFSLNELRSEGFLSQAINNYLAVLGKSFTEEVQSLDELIQNYNFENMQSTGSIKYDTEKLLWFNHKWIEKSDDLLAQARPFLEKAFPESKSIDEDKLKYLLDKVKTDLKTLQDIKTVLSFYFTRPKTSLIELEKEFGLEESQKAQRIIFENIQHLEQPDLFLTMFKKQGKELNIKMKALFGTLRYMLTGSFSGSSLHDLLDILSLDEVKNRIKKLQ